MGLTSSLDRANIKSRSSKTDSADLASGEVSSQCCKIINYASLCHKHVTALRLFWMFTHAGLPCDALTSSRHVMCDSWRTREYIAVLSQYNHPPSAPETSDKGTRKIALAP